MSTPAFYFDGKSSRRHDVRLAVNAGIAELSGDVAGSWPISDLRVSERTRHGARKVTFPDGAYLEMLDNASFNELLADSGYQDSLTVRTQQSGRGVLAALGITLTILVLAYLYGIPTFSKVVASALPERVERMVGGETLAFLDKHMFKPSTLPLERQQSIASSFKALVPHDAPHYELVFRKSEAGPNAFALTSGQIVVTDEIVKLMNDDDAIMGILAHELGHVHERHMMRLIIQTSTVAAISTVLFGDVSAVVANAPAVLLDMKYSRDLERDADDYAIALFKARHLSMSTLARVFEKLGEKSDHPAPYLSSHPATSERIARVREAR